MNCYPESDLQDYLLERLDPQQEVKLSRHLDQCPVCRSAIEAFSDDGFVRGYLDAVRREEIAGENKQDSQTAGDRVEIADAKWSSELIDRRLLPKRFGKFELRELLGSGGFGTVYLAWDSELVRNIAIKIPHLARLTPQFRKSFLSEARAAASLCHSNIVSVLESGEFEGISYIASEYIPGKTLREHLQTQKNRVRGSDAARLLLALTKAVEHAHQNKIVHRDIKPSNVLLDERTHEDGLPFRPLLTDFGTARLVDADQSATVEDVLVGTAQYMAPERIVSGDTRLESDIYALGVLLFEIISGNPPNQGFDSSTTMHRIVTMDSPELHHTVSGVPRDLSAICSKCLERDPNQRYSSATDLAEDLRRFLNHVPTVARPLGTGRRLARWCRRNPIPSFAVVLTFLTLSLIVTGQTWNAAALRHINQQLTDANRRAESSEKRTLGLLYAADLRLAELALHQGDIQTAREIVSRYIPEEGEADLRGIEWHYLEKELRPNKRLIADHTQPLYAIAFNQNQETFATAGQESLIYIHDLSSTNLLQTIDSEQVEVNGLAYSSNGKLLASTGDDGSVCIWDKGFLMQRMSGHDGKAYGVQFIRNDTQLVTCGTDARVKIWDVERGSILHSYTDHTAEVEALTVSDSGRWLASVGRDHRVIVRDLSLDRPAFKTPTKYGTLCDVAISADDRFIATVVSGTGTRALTVYELASQTVVAERTSSSAFVSVCFSEAADRLMTTDRSGTLRVWKLTVVPGEVQLSEEPLAVVPMSNDRIYASEFLNQTNSVVTVGHSGKVLVTGCDPSVWEKSIQQEVFASRLNIESAIQFRSFKFRPHSDNLIVAANSVVGTLNCTQPNRCDLLQQSDGRLWDDVVVSASGEWMLIAGFDPNAIATGEVRLPAMIKRIEYSTGKESVLWSSQDACVVTSMALSPGGELLAVATTELRDSNEIHHVMVMNSQSGIVRYKFQSSSGSVSKFVPNSTSLVYGNHYDIHLVDSLSGKETLLEAAHQHAQNQLAVSSDGKWLATSDQDHVIKLWRLPGLQPHAKLLGHVGHISSICFSPDNRTLFSSGLDGTIKAWNVEVGRLVMNLREDKSKPISRMALSGDGKRMAYTEAEGLLRILDIQND